MPERDCCGALWNMKRLFSAYLPTAIMMLLFAAVVTACDDASDSDPAESGRLEGVWEITDTTDEEIDVGATLTFKDGGKCSIRWSDVYEMDDAQYVVSGNALKIMMSGRGLSIVMDGTYYIDNDYLTCNYAWHVEGNVFGDYCIVLKKKR